MEKPLRDNVNGVNTMPKAVSIWLVRWNILISVDTEVYYFMFTTNYIYIYIYTHINLFICDDAIKITSELHDPIACKSHLHNKKKKDLTESIGMVSAEYPPKVKSELFSQL